MARTTGTLGFLARLRKNDRGNTLAILAASMIPLCGFAGSAIDLGRLYVVRTRLQTACDAGVLAGRKFMDTTTQQAGQALTGTALTQANAYFKNNFDSSWGGSGWFIANTDTFSPTAFNDANGVMQVSGSASAQVPMTLMRMFGSPSRTLQATCQASFDTPDTDVMFVLDTTGSMACLPSDSPTADCGGSTSFTLADGSTDYYDTEKSGSKMQAVRDAVGTFYDTLAANMSKGTYVRYGFVPYSSTVNAGAAIYAVNPDYMAKTWPYQTRWASADYQISKDNGVIDTTKNQTQCNAVALATTRSPAVTTPLTYNSSGQATKQVGSWANNKCTITTYTYGPQWTYTSYTLNTVNYLATINGGTVSDPSKAASSKTFWQGCIEEVRSGVTSYNSVSSYNIDKLPADLNPDYVPGTTDNTKWGPMWPSAEYARNGLSTKNSVTGFYTTSNDTENADTKVTPDDSNHLNPSNPNYANYSARNQGWIPCPNPVMRLTDTDAKTEPGVTTYLSKAAVTTYMNNLHPHGGTYHDTGMIWGLRMLSPQGIFAADTAKHNGHADPKRVIVFLTDGAMAPSLYTYGMYGIESFDKRIRGTATDDLSAYHNARFLATCQKAAEKNIQVWVVAVGQSLTQPLKDCVGAAHPERAIFVNKSSDLSTTFKQIATAVSMLRISQ